MKEDVERPTRLVDLNRLTLDEIEAGATAASAIGALATNTDIANHPLIRQSYPLLSQAILSRAPRAQLRNMATTGGNLMQRTRCPYFYDTAMPCNKREPGTGCAAHARGSTASTRSSAGASTCIATHPSRHVRRALRPGGRRPGHAAPGGERTIPIDEFHRLPGDTPRRDTNLEHGELITAIDLPRRGLRRSTHAYLKVRDRTSLRLRPRLGRRRPARSTAARSGGPRRARRGGPQALAQPARPRRRSGGRSRSEEQLPAGGRGGRSRGARPLRAQRVQGRAGAAGDRARPDAREAAA